MGNNQIQDLVIDASIARAAGGENSINPTSKNCRNCLKIISDNGYYLALTKEINDEWKKHQSRYAKTWLKLMFSRKQVKPLDLSIDQTLWTQIETLAPTDRQRDIMIKDIHLIEAAIATDKTIIALDDTVRYLFAKIALDIHQLQGIIWVNPSKEKEQVIVWLENGANSEINRYLESQII
ncbi:MAG TPA: hypothetical protein DCF68_06345 [Cyanothece sp. UBA12306]|nr:hypothetical protein [Cyanothece sp. UBA12306]